jgi:hypothetical protein
MHIAKVHPCVQISPMFSSKYFIDGKIVQVLKMMAYNSHHHMIEGKYTHNYKYKES